MSQARTYWQSQAFRNGVQSLLHADGESGVGLFSFGNQVSTDIVEFLRRTHVGDVRAKLASAMQARRVAARELAHQHGALLFPESINHQSIVFEHTFTLLFERRIRWNGIASQRRAGLCENPWAAEAGSGDHDPVNVVTIESFDNGLGGIQVTVSDQRDVLEERLDGRYPIPIGRAFEHVLRGSPVHGQCRRAGSFDDLSYLVGIDFVTRAAESDFGRDGCRSTRFDDLFDNLSHAVRCA